MKKKKQIPVGSGLVLVVDDEAIMRKTAKSILIKLGYDVIFAEDGEQAISVFSEHYEEIKVTILDMAMPKKSGKEAYIEMKRIYPELKVLLISGFKKDKRIEDVLKLGVNGFIQKPYSMITLAQEIKRVSEGSSQPAPAAAADEVQPKPLPTPGDRDVVEKIQKLDLRKVEEEEEAQAQRLQQTGFETVILKTKRVRTNKLDL